jgi:hypothetical protein
VVDFDAAGAYSSIITGDKKISDDYVYTFRNFGGLR